MLTIEENVKNKDGEELIDILFKRYAGFVYKMAFGYINDKHVAEDIVSEVFLKVVKHRSKFTDKSHDDWLALLAIYTKTCCYNMYKYNSRHKTVLIEDTDVADKFSVNEKLYQYDPVEQAISKERNSKLYAALLKLSQKEQDIIKLKYYFNAKNTEIADIFNMNESTVSSTIANIKKKLKKFLEASGI